ncbi:MAG: cytochrome c oxidase assembly factor Coa1 family protein [Chthoniobacter sp.]|nr:cytochrome c oxidase assembly factor Coa1 family protein [Chthoniobacter sp.]
MSTETPPIPPVKKTNWWLIGCGGCLSLIVLGIIAGGAIFFGVMKVIKSTEPYKTAVAGATNSPEVQAELGTPIEPGFLPQGNVNSDTSGGTTTETANLTIPLKGSKASGSLHYAAKKTGADWEVSDFTVTVEGGGKKIHVGP